MTNDQIEIEGLLARRIGLDPVTVGPRMVLRAARRRMAELGLDDLGVYASRLGQSEPELQALIEEVVVPESWFFRDERPFGWLADQVRARWVGDPSRAPLRVLSLACAGGEEPYSIAITLRDAGLPARRFRIDAVDVSARRLAIARRGFYSANAFRGCELGDRAQYFREHAQGYEVDPAVRSMVRFLQASVVEPRLLEDSPPYDVVFCRNLLIYLDAPARNYVITAIDRLLAADGVLFIGHADRLELAGEPSRFTAVGEPGCFAYRKTTPSTPRPDWTEPRPPETSQARAGRGSPDQSREDLRRLQSPCESGLGTISPRNPLGASPFGLDPSHPRLGGQDPGVAGVKPALPAPPPGVSVAGPTEGLPGRRPDPARTEPRPPETPLQPSLLEQAEELANRGRHAEAIAACEQHIRLKGPGASAYHLMGMICQAAGDRRRAEECFHKTVYLDPEHDEALLALSLLAERRGDRGAAAGFRRRARRTSATQRPEGSESR
jgi:chemotaxis protein methyltransferase WspC